jgi:hypothetical protein
LGLPAILSMGRPASPDALDVAAVELGSQWCSNSARPSGRCRGHQEEYFADSLREAWHPSRAQADRPWYILTNGCRENLVASPWSGRGSVGRAGASGGLLDRYGPRNPTPSPDRGSRSPAGSSPVLSAQVRALNLGDRYPPAPSALVSPSYLGAPLFRFYILRCCRGKRPLRPSVKAGIGSSCLGTICKMHHTAQKEQFSLAYVSAVAAVAGYAVYSPSVDDESVDLGVSAAGIGKVRSPRLELQVKCTSASSLDGSVLRYEIKKKNYDDLRHTNLLVPRILVVVTVPERISDWSLHTEEALVLRRCGYWVSILGHPTRANSRSVTLSLPRRQVFSPTSLRDIMSLISEGGKP